MNGDPQLLFHIFKVKYLKIVILKILVSFAGKKPLETAWFDTHDCGN